MRLTQARISRYLDMQKKLNDYLLKMSGKNRQVVITLSEARYFLLQGEQKLREVATMVSEGKTDE